MEADFELLERWRAGDVDAGNELFHRHFDAVYRFFANKVGDEADDLIQRCFLACIESQERFRGDASFRGYLFGIARNVLRRYLRDKATHGRRFDELEGSVHDVGPGPSLLVAERREQQILLAALRRLPVDLQITLELYYWESLSGSELASVLGIPEGTVRGRIRRAKELLERELAAVTREPSLLRSTIADLESWAKALREAAMPPGAAKPPAP